MRLHWKGLAAALLVAIASIGSVWLYNGGPKSLRIRSEFEHQMLSQLPKQHQMMGGTCTPIAVRVTGTTEGLKGYSIQYQVTYNPGATFLSGLQLIDDGFGHYCCTLDTLDGKVIYLSIPG
jgi:hypothetical protein